MVRNVLNLKLMVGQSVVIVSNKNIGLIYQTGDRILLYYLSIISLLILITVSTDLPYSETILEFVSCAPLRQGI